MHKLLKIWALITKLILSSFGGPFLVILWWPINWTKNFHKKRILYYLSMVVILQITVLHFAHLNYNMS